MAGQAIRPVVGGRVGRPGRKVREPGTQPAAASHTGGMRPDRLIAAAVVAVLGGGVAVAATTGSDSARPTAVPRPLTAPTTSAPTTPAPSPTTTSPSAR